MSQNVNFPNTTVTKLPATQTVLNSDQRVLFVGQMVAAGTATSGQLYTEIGNDNSWDTLFGANSMIAGMLRAAREENGVTRFDAIPLDDASGTPATCIVTFGGGPATASGTINVYIGSEVNHAYELSVSSTDAIDDIGGALETAVNADTNAPFTAVNASGVVTMTADNDGTEANSFLLAYDGEAEAITVALTGWTAGATDPTLTNLFDVIAEERYQSIVWPGVYTITTVQTLLDDRWNTDGQILDGVCIRSISGDLATVKAATSTLNSQSIVTLDDKLMAGTDYKGPSVGEINYIKASKVAAIRALRLTQDASISKYVVTTATNDQYGSPSISTLPYANTPITSLPVVKTGMGWTRSEIAEINAAGGSVIGNNRNNTNIIMGEMVTSYLTDSAANPDTTYKYLNYVDTASNGAEYIWNNSVSDFDQSRLTDGSLIQGISINNEKSIRAQFAKYYQDLSGDVYVLFQKGETALNYFKENLTVTLNLVTGTVYVTEKNLMVTQLRNLLITMQLAFSAES